jgi:hypothetical protein
MDSSFVSAAVYIEVGTDSKCACLLLGYERYETTFLQSSNQFAYRALLPTLVAARLAQSVSMGAFSLAQDPTNEYLKLHAQPARMGLKAFWRTERRVIDSLFAYAVNPKASDLHHVFKRPFHSVK